MLIILLYRGMMPILDQNTAEAISKTVTNAIDAGATGIAVLLAVGLIIMGGGIAALVWKVIVPLLKQVIQLTSQVTAMVERTNEAIEHSNETNKLMASAQTNTTGETQGMRKDIRAMADGFNVLSLNFGNYQTLNSDTTDALRAEMVAFKSEIKLDIEKMLESIATSNTFVEKIANDVDQAVREHEIIMKTGETILKRCDAIIALLPPPPPASIINITNTGATPDKPADTADSAAAA